MIFRKMWEAIKDVFGDQEYETLNNSLLEGFIEKKLYESLVLETNISEFIKRTLDHGDYVSTFYYEKDAGRIADIL